MKRLHPVKKEETTKPGSSYKDLVMDAWDRLYGPEERAQRREQLWAKEELHRKNKGRL